VSRVAQRPARTRRHATSFVRDLVVIVVVALLASFLIRTFLIQSFYIPSASMEHTLLGEPGHEDRILVDRLVPGVIPIQRGDVVVFTDPGGWLESEQTTPSRPNPIQAVLAAITPFGADDDDHLVKRVIGLPGDRVACCNALGQMTVNGAPLVEPYAVVPAGYTAVSRDPFDVVVPAGKLWVMGDNRYDSSDSRYHQDTASKGFVPMADVTGRAFVISWPVSRWSWLSDYPATFGGVPKATR
jgi:signal peptidase I